MRKRFLSILLSVCMAITMLPASAKADELGEAVQALEYSSLNTGSTIEVSTFADLQAAVNEATTSLSLKLSNDYVTEKGTLRIPEGSNIDITLDLNGKTLNGGASNAIYHEGSGTLTITDSTYNGKIIGSGHNLNLIRNTSNGTINIAGGTIRSEGYLSRNIFNQSSGTINITGGTFIAEGYSVTNVYNYSNGAVNISGGKFTSQGDNACVLYNGVSKNVTIYGGSLSAIGKNVRGIYSVSPGLIKIYGGSVSAEGDDATAIYIANNFSIKAQCLMMAGGRMAARGNRSCGIYSSTNSIIEIYGGDVRAFGNAANAICGVSYGATYIYGGEVYANGNSAYGINMKYNGTVRLNNALVTAEGDTSCIGIYADNIYVDSGTSIINGSGQAQNKAADISFLSPTNYAEGSSNFNGSSRSSYNSKNITSYKYIQYSLTNPVAVIAGTTYTSLNSAFDAAARTGGNTINLLSSPILFEPIKISKGKYTINLNGYSIVSYVDTVFELYNDATLTIADNSKVRGSGWVTCHYGSVTIMMYDMSNLVINGCNVLNNYNRGHAIFNMGSGSVKLIDARVDSANEIAVSSQKIIVSGTCMLQGEIYAMSTLPEFSGYTGPVKVTAYKRDGDKRVEVPYSEDYLRQYVYLIFEPDTEE